MAIAITMRLLKYDRKMKGLTSFQQKVYTVVKKIPVGQVRTYAWVARMAGRPGAARAIGSLLKKNPFPLIVPCHRVINSDGSLGGYVFGGDLKKRLLEIEGVRLSRCALLRHTKCRSGQSKSR